MIRFFSAIFFIFALSGAVFSQGLVTIYDPNSRPEEFKLSEAEEKAFSQQVLPKVEKIWPSDTCGNSFEAVGQAEGAFTKAGAKQKLIFFAYCQTGNGLGNNGLLLLENGAFAGIYLIESGWPAGFFRLPDVNKNGVDEFVLFYSGGIHQGMGGTGADIQEFKAGRINGIGWFQAYSFGEETGDFSWMVTVKPGKLPIYYRQRYLPLGEDKWRRSGKIAAFKLKKVSTNKFKQL